MTKVIPGIGKVRFPDGMTAEEIEDAIEHDILKKPRKEVKVKDEEESQEEGLQEVTKAIADLTKAVSEIKFDVKSPDVNVEAPRVNVAAPQVTVQAPVVPEIKVPQASVIIQENKRKPFNVRFDIERDQYGSIKAIIAKEI
jgi:hypothetical protein